MEPIPYTPLTDHPLYDFSHFAFGAVANVLCMLVEIRKEDAMFRHYAHILANPIEAASNPYDAKIRRLKKVYRILNPKIEE